MSFCHLAIAVNWRLMIRVELPIDQCSLLIERDINPKIVVGSSRSLVRWRRISLSVGLCWG